DDFYGQEAFVAMGRFLSSPNLDDGAIVPYKLESTLSAMGAVARGICRINDGCVVSMEELKSIEKKNGVIFNTGPDAAKQELKPDAPVSMNFFGYPLSILPKFEQYFNDFIAACGHDPKSESYLSTATDCLVRNGHIKMRAIDADSQWFGVTYKEDRETAVKRLAQLTAQGVYPAGLWK
ncbi:MAG: hypothetical protein FWF01_04805, partial [Alphaproteobacteria bacterium]|nr:hypothetical protein [Alphaproteobacteria bacterium]